MRLPIQTSGASRVETVRSRSPLRTNRSAHGSGKRDEPKITLAACWAHIRRGYYESRHEAPQRIGFILYQIQLLYDIEKELREERAGPRLRQATRESESAMIVRRLHRLLVRLKTQGRVRPTSGFGEAIDYALGQWPGALVYLEQGRVEIDNNPIERSIRSTAIGKKNWLFFGEADIGERSAIIYTIVECCRRRDIDPYAYLRDVLTRLPSSTNWQLKDLTPAAWAKAQRSQVCAQAA